MRAKAGRPRDPWPQVRSGRLIQLRGARDRPDHNPHQERHGRAVRATSGNSARFLTGIRAYCSNREILRPRAQLAVAGRLLSRSPL